LAYAIVRPDFLFFTRNSSGSIVADIVDPHGTQFADALPKAKGLAAYAESHGSAYRRIDVIAKVGDKLRALDLKDSSVRKAVLESTDARVLYETTAVDY
jgi:hypothetical protein